MVGNNGVWAGGLISTKRDHQNSTIVVCLKPLSFSPLTLLWHLYHFVGATTFSPQVACKGLASATGPMTARSLFPKDVLVCPSLQTLMTAHSHLPAGRKKGSLPGLKTSKEKHWWSQKKSGTWKFPQLKEMNPKIAGVSMHCESSTFHSFETRSWQISQTASEQVGHVMSSTGRVWGHTSNKTPWGQRGGGV